jgi:excisionase family DNA binding protein
MSTSLDGLPNKALYTPQEVADYFSISVRTVYSWREEGKIKGLKISEKVLRIPRNEVVEIILLARGTDE